MALSTSIKKISVTYDGINESNTFTSGDFISGRITLEVAKDVQIDSLVIKAKGKANVRWSERHGKKTHVYRDKETYFKLRQFFIRESHEEHGHTLLTDQAGQSYCNVVAPGIHVYPFTFQIPQQNMPASFKGPDYFVGRIVYSLEAKLSRSMRMASKAQAEFTFVTKADMTIPDLMSPQYGTKDKKMKLFTSGSVSMNINTERMGYYLGEGLKVVASVLNNSSRPITPKYHLYQKQSFFARGKRRLCTAEILKEKGEPIEPSERQSVTKVLNMPSDLSVSILNCRIIKVEYRLRVYLDVPYASDPEIKFPVVILPFTRAMGATAPPPDDKIGFDPFWTNNQAGWNSTPYSAPPPAYEDPPPPYQSDFVMYPSLSDHTKK